MKKTNAEANKVYKERRKNIDRLITEINRKFEKHGAEKEISWAHCGDLGHVQELLQQVNEFLGN